MATKTSTEKPAETTVEDLERELAEHLATITAADAELERLQAEKERLDRVAYELRLMASADEQGAMRDADTGRLREIVAEIDVHERARRAAAVGKSRARAQLTDAKASRMAAAHRARSLDALDDIAAKDNYAEAVAVLRALKVEAASLPVQLAEATQNLDAVHAVELQLRQSQIGMRLEIASVAVLEAEARLKRHERAVALAGIGEASEKAERLRPAMEEAVAAYEAAAGIVTNLEWAAQQAEMAVQMAERKIMRARQDKSVAV